MSNVKSYILDINQYIRDSKYIHKFLPLERALNLLNRKTLWFSNPEIWPDPYEKRFINAKYDGSSKFSWKGRVFCACFTNNSTSEASWNAYSNGELCIQFTFNRAELIEILNAYSMKNKSCQIYFDKVEYMQTKFINKPLLKIPFNPKLSSGATTRSREFKARMLLLKRKAFEYEQEFRAIIVKEKVTKELGIELSIPDINRLIEKITIGPNVKNDTAKMLTELFIHTYNFSRKKIEQSRLYAPLPNDIFISLR